MDDWKCPNVGRCELFPRLRSEHQLRACLDAYCLDDYRRCARWRHAQQHGTRPPSELLPTGVLLESLARSSSG